MSDRDADFTAYVRTHGRALLLTAFHLTGDADRADDLLVTALARTYLRGGSDAPEVMVGTALSRWPRWSWPVRRGDQADLIVAAQLDDNELVLGAFQRLRPEQRVAIARWNLTGLPGGEAPDDALRDLGVLLHDLEFDDSVTVEDRLRAAFEAGAARLATRDDLAGAAIARAHRMRWARRTGSAAAAAALVVAAIVLPGALQRADTAPEVPPRVVADGALPPGPPPRVPYVANPYEVGGGFLYDGSVRVPIPAGRRVLPFGRVHGGWLVVRGDSHVHTDDRPHDGEVGVLSTEGSFTSFGIATEWKATLSPDGTRAAFVTRADDRLWLIVTDVATGLRTASTPAVALLGWNPEGIWYRSGITYVWWPGAEPRAVHNAGAMDVHRGSTWITDLTDGCVAVAVLRRDGWLARAPRQCGDGVLSPSGRYVTFPTGSIHAIPGADVSRLRMVDAVSDVTWEDTRHALLHVSTGDAFFTREIVARCDMVTQRCELAYDNTITGPQPVPRLTLHEP
ncbi:MAG TPA: hypothetical protein VFB74_00320 [Kribbellaceae bacterium]|nr:hypothetical protein [Kribbellaceae bacterium]